MMKEIRKIMRKNLWANHIITFGVTYVGSLILVYLYQSWMLGDVNHDVMSDALLLSIVAIWFTRNQIVEYDYPRTFEQRAKDAELMKVNDVVEYKTMTGTIVRQHISPQMVDVEFHSGTLTLAKVDLKLKTPKET